MLHYHIPLGANQNPEFQNDHNVHSAIPLQHTKKADSGRDLKSKEDQWGLNLRQLGC